jgi:hypothetical protein
LIAGRLKDTLPVTKPADGGYFIAFREEIQLARHVDALLHVFGVVRQAASRLHRQLPWRGATSFAFVLSRQLVGFHQEDKAHHFMCRAAQFRQTDRRNREQGSQRTFKDQNSNDRSNDRRRGGAAPSII